MANGAAALRGLRLKSVVLVVVLSSLAASCQTGPPSWRQSAPSTLTATPAIAVTALELEGKWGLASFRNEADRPRTEAEAKVACSNPYEIGHGANGGVMMHLADQPQPSEHFLKVASDGRTFLGPSGPAGVPQDRLIVSYDNNVLITQWLDPGVAERYGTMVYVRCGSA